MMVWNGLLKTTVHGINMTTIKLDLDRLLTRLLGREELVEQWWISANFEFGMKAPIQVYQSGEEGRQHVIRYVQSAISDEYR